MRSSRIQSRGFTLIELILVMTIICIASALIVPSISSFAVGRANHDTATLIVSLAGYARTQSISQGRTYRLNFDTSKDVIWLTAGNAGVFSELTDEFGEQFPIASGSMMRTDMVARTHGNSGRTYVEFNSNGRCQIRPKSG